MSSRNTGSKYPSAYGHTPTYRSYSSIPDASISGISRDLTRDLGISNAGVSAFGRNATSLLDSDFSLSSPRYFCSFLINIKVHLYFFPDYTKFTFAVFEAILLLLKRSQATLAQATVALARMEVVQSPSIRRIRPTNQLQLEPLVYRIPLTPIPLLDSVLRTPTKIVSQAFPTIFELHT